MKGSEKPYFLSIFDLKLENYGKQAGSQSACRGR